MSSIDYVEQLRFLLFLKTTDERQKGLRREQSTFCRLDSRFPRRLGTVNMYLHGIGQATGNDDGVEAIDLGKRPASILARRLST